MKIFGITIGKGSNKPPETSSEKSLADDFAEIRTEFKRRQAIQKANIEQMDVATDHFANEASIREAQAALSNPDPLDTFKVSKRLLEESVDVTKPNDVIKNAIGQLQETISGVLKDLTMPKLPDDKLKAIARTIDDGLAYIKKIKP